jgi:hypothetical protein
MRKFIFNTSLISAVFSGWSTVQATRHGPRDWRLALLWLSWGISVALAVGSIRDEAKQQQIGR